MTTGKEILDTAGIADPRLPIDDALDALGLHTEVREEAATLWIRSEAQRALAKATSTAGVGDPSLTPLPDLLAEPDDDPVYRVDGLLPTGGRVLLAAQYKAGKTTMVLNLVRSLADWEPFLADAGDEAGGHAVRPLLDGEKVALFDLELDRRTLRRWLRTQKITNTDRVLAEAFRGRLAELDILDDERRAAWATYLADRGVKVLVLDCLAPLLTLYAIDESDNTGVANVLAALDRLAAQAGVEEMVLVHHMGHHGERSRGASRLRDWPDAEWRLTRESPAFPGAEPAPDAARFFVAEGRDVSVPERKVRHNSVTGRVWTVEGNRAQQKASKHEAAVLDIIMSSPGATNRQIEAMLKGGGAGMGSQSIRQTLDALKLAGKVHTCAGTGKKSRAEHYAACSEAADCPDPADCPTAREARDKT